MSAIHLQIRTQDLWVRGSLQKQMLAAVNTTEKLSFASDVEAFGDLNTQSLRESSKKFKISSQLRDVISK